LSPHSSVRDRKRADRRRERTHVPDRTSGASSVRKEDAGGCSPRSNDRRIRGCGSDLAGRWSVVGTGGCHAALGSRGADPRARVGRGRIRLPPNHGDRVVTITGGATRPAPGWSHRDRAVGRGRAPGTRGGCVARHPAIACSLGSGAPLFAPGAWDRSRSLSPSWIW